MKAEVLGDKPVHVAIHLPQTPHRVARSRNQAPKSIWTRESINFQFEPNREQTQCPAIIKTKQ